MTLEQIAQDIVDGFFIGGGDDSLEQPNLTKHDLKYAIAEALKTEREAGAKVVESVEPIVCPKEITNKIAKLIRDRQK